MRSGCVPRQQQCNGTGMVHPVKFCHLVTSTFCRSILRIVRRNKAGKNRGVERNSNPVSIFILKNLATLEKKWPKFEKKNKRKEKKAVLSARVYCCTFRNSTRIRQYRRCFLSHLLINPYCILLCSACVLEYHVVYNHIISYRIEYYK